MERGSGDLGRRAVAGAVLLVAAWVLFKFVVGAVTKIAWLAVVVLAIGAAVWAASTLARR